jgi:hypothetical protein
VERPRAIADMVVDSHHDQARPPSAEALRPSSRAVKDGEDLDLVAAHAIGRYERRGGDDQFARVRHAASAAEVRMCRQPFRVIQDFRNDSRGGGGIVARDEVADLFEVA